MTKCDVAIIGAGPYGLSATAHLRKVKGLDVHTFGEPMSFWERNMPTGMLLRSVGQHRILPTEPVFDPGGLPSGKQQSLFQPRTTRPLRRLWTLVSTSAIPDLDRRKIARVESHARGFRLILEEGETVLARRLVVAAGIGSFHLAARPNFAGLPCSLAVSHS